MEESKLSVARETKEYATKWFELDAQPIWQQHILPRKDSIRTYLEIGVGGGDSAIWTLENLGVEKAYLVDAWKAVSDKHDQSTYDAAREKAKMRLQPYIKDRRVTLYELTSRDFFGAAQEGDDHWDIDDGTLDFCYVDGSHTGWDAMFDMANVFYKLRPQRRLKEEHEILRAVENPTRPGLIFSKEKWYEEGGIMVVDDQNRIHHRQQAETRLASYGYLIAYTGRYQMVAWSNRQLILTKV